MRLFTVRAAALRSRAERGSLACRPGTQKAHGFLGTVGSPLDQGGHRVVPARPDGRGCLGAGPRDPHRSIPLPRNALPADPVTMFSAGIAPPQRIVAIVAGPDGNLWFTEYDGDRIERITPAGVVTEYSVPPRPHPPPRAAPE